MQCADIRLQLEALGSADSQPAALAKHLEHCPQCREHADALRLQQLLGTLPLREPRAGFDTRVLTAAMAAQPRSANGGSRAWLAAAAGLVLAVFVAFQWQQAPTTEYGGELVDAAQVPAIELEPVQVMLNSDKALQNVTLTVELPSHLLLEGYPDSQRLQWTASLSAGGNKLVLPVQFRNDVVRGMDNAEIATSEIVVELEHEGLRKQFRVPLQRGVHSSGKHEVIYQS